MFSHRFKLYILVLFLLGLFLTLEIQPVQGYFSLPKSVNQASSLQVPAQEMAVSIKQRQITASALLDSAQKNTIAETSLLSALVEQGRNLYSTEQFSQAVEVWQQALQGYQEQGDRLHQAMTLTYLSLAYQKLGQWSEGKKAIATSIELLNQLTINTHDTALIFAQALNTRSRLEFFLGKAEVALETSKQATQIYEQIEDESGVMGSLINQAQILEALGMHQRTCKTLLRAVKQKGNCNFSTSEEFEAVIQTFQEQSDVQLKSLGLLSLGNILRLLGDLARSQRVLEQIHQIVQSPMEDSATWLSFGKTKQAQYRQAKELYERTIGSEKNKAQTRAILNAREALDFYQQAAVIAEPLSTVLGFKIQAQLHRLSLLREFHQWLKGIDNKNKNQREIVANLADQISSQVIELLRSGIADLPPSRTSIYAKLNLAESLSQLEQNTQFISTAIKYAEKATQQARALQDWRGESYALGILGHLYEKTHHWTQAQARTQEALNLARQIHSNDIVYQWQWQLGRIYRRQGKQQKAIAAYESAVKTLESVRNDLLTINTDIQFSFRDNVEPVYRELIDLLLSSKELQPSQNELQKSLYFVESLQLAELENFLQCNPQGFVTVPFKRTRISENALLARVNEVINKDSKAALIYSIILDDYLAVILKLPGQKEFIYHRTKIKKKILNSKLHKLRFSTLTKADFEEEDKIPLNEVYQWLIEPFQEDLEAAEIKTLVFILDGSFWNIPLAALHDGNQFLVEKYAVALIPTIQLLNSQTSKVQQLKALVAGVSKERQDLELPSIPFVKEEVKLVASVFNNFKIFPEEKFTTEAFQREVKSSSYDLIHLATHGKFSSNLEETFILTSDKEPLSLNQLTTLLTTKELDEKNALQLLFLSACQTATGDKRALLGLAGIAIKSGAQSTIASLWKVDDKATKFFVEKFYENFIKQGIKKVSKAEALRLAQKSLLENLDYNTPRDWAAFVLVGDWL